MAVTFKPKKGSIVRHAGERYVVVEITDLHQLFCRSLASKEMVQLPIIEIAPDENQNLEEKATAKSTELATISAEDWADASRRLDPVRELARKGRYNRSLAEVEAVARLLEKSPKTIYRWLSKFDKVGTIEAFLRKERTDKGDGRIDEAVEALIQESIKRLLMKREYGTYDDVHVDVKRSCLKKGLRPPGITTIRDRFLKISQADRVASRQGAKKAKEKYTPLMGSFPGADHPLAVIQIDHTPADLIIVDDAFRKPIGRPVLTVAIDVFSRMVMGFNMWLEAPSAASVGLCLWHAMLPKEKWLESRGLKAVWNCYGRPRKIHTDNAKEFRGTVLGRACKSYGIDLEQRPKGRPQYGGHVERGFRTYLRKVHSLPGTTFSNTRSKFEYDADGKAIMTLDEFEFWFATYLTKKYHVDMHTGISTTPTARYRDGILGTDGHPGIGLPERFIDEERIRLDFLPFKERTVQEYGVLIDYIYYNDDVLRSRIHEMDIDNPRQARKFIFRRDPHDVSVIYFWDPDLKTYREIPTAHRGRPPVSMWEVSTVVRELRAKGKAEVDENLIYEGIDEMREIERSAAEKTRSARRNQQRRLESEKRRKKTASRKPSTIAPPHAPTPEINHTQIFVPAPITGVKVPTQYSAALFDDDEAIIPFDDIDLRS